MGKYVTVEVSIDDWDDRELADEMSGRGYVCIRSDEYIHHGLDQEDWQYLLEMIDKQPEDWYTRRIRDKIVFARFGV